MDRTTEVVMKACGPDGSGVSWMRDSRVLFSFLPRPAQCAAHLATKREVGLLQGAAACTKAGQVCIVHGETLLQYVPRGTPADSTSMQKLSRGDFVDQLAGIRVAESHLGKRTPYTIQHKHLGGSVIIDSGMSSTQKSTTVQSAFTELPTTKVDIFLCRYKGLYNIIQYIVV